MKQRIVCKGVILALLGVIAGFAHALRCLAGMPEPPPPPCQPTTTNCVAWNCGAGSVSGTVSPTSTTICVGNSASATISVTCHDGRKTRTCYDNCNNSWPESGKITYSASSWWEPPIPDRFIDCGTFSFTAKAKGVSQDSDCQTNTSTVSVGTFTVKVVGVASLVPDLPPGQGGLEPGSDPPTYWVCAWCSGDIIVTATSCPELAADQLPDCWTFTGGVEIDKLHHKVSRESLLSGPVTLTVSAGASTKTIVLKADEEKRIYNSHIPQQECRYENFVDPEPWTDKCSNSVSVCCVGCQGWPNYQLGHYEYYFNNIRVGCCYFDGGENVFLYKTTKHNCRILRTWHLTREPGTPTRWVVTKYDCMTLTGPSYNCRAAPAWDVNWGRPADELVNVGYPANSCENQGTPFSPCPPW